jgi:uncharacterized protein
MRVVAITGPDGAAVCERCAIADRPWTRMRGLLGKSGLAQGDGMLFNHTGSVHTMFMRFPIDVVFLDADLRVRAVRSSVPAWKAVKERGARVTLELAAGEAARVGIEPGMALSLASD